MADSFTPFPLASKSYQPRSGTQSIERLLNMFAVPAEKDGKRAFTLHGDPGLLLWKDLGTGKPCRGLLRALKQVWVVSGETLYAINEDTAIVTTIGEVRGTGLVRMANNSTQIGIAADNVFYAATFSGGVVPVSTFADPADICSQDGYGILPERNTLNLWITNLDDMDTVDGLDFTTVDANPDKVVACASVQHEIFALKRKTSEVYANTGNAAFPFQRTTVIQRGCYAPRSVALAEGALMFLSDEKRVCMMQGYQPVVVSTPSIDKMISEAYAPNSAEAFAYTLEGQTNYVINFADKTLVYSLTTGLWRERRTYGLNRWRAQCHCKTLDGKLLVGDYANGKIYQLKLDTYTDDSEIIERHIIEPPLHAGARNVIVDELFLDLETGVGLTSGQGSAPVVMMSWSDDDGRTWSSDMEASMGAIGEYRYRAQWNCLGMSKNRTFRYRITDPVKIAILANEARMEATER